LRVQGGDATKIGSAAQQQHASGQEKSTQQHSVRSSGNESLYLQVGLPLAGHVPTFGSVA
jgi:hypothetical protein